MDRSLEPWSQIHHTLGALDQICDRLVEAYAGESRNDEPPRDLIRCFLVSESAVEVLRHEIFQRNPYALERLSSLQVTINRFPRATLPTHAST